MSSCCSPPEPEHSSSCCGDKNKTQRRDILLWSTITLVTIGYLLDLAIAETLHSFSSSLGLLANSIRAIMDTMWIGLGIGILFVGLLGRIPKEFVASLLGKGDSFIGIVRATFAGVLLDLCSHGILLVAMRLYQRGASLAQVMAFLIASPWNSLSLTVILITLIGWGWTLLFIFCSMIIGILTGVIFNTLETRGYLAGNPNTIELDNFDTWNEAKSRLRSTRINTKWLSNMLLEGIKDSRMIVRWLLLGVLLAALIRTFVPVDVFQHYLGATLAGLGTTLLIATLLEICSEGSTPIAADIVNRAHAPGNGFAFLMAGVSTDYTEIVSLKETTGSWKVAFLLPIITLPQIVILSLIMNMA